mgnify:FL=1
MKDSKKCTKCQEEKSLDQFNKDKTKKDGLRPICKICTGKKQKQYAQKNKAKIAEYQKEYAKKNQKTLQENKRRHYLKHKDKIIKRVNSWHNKNYANDESYKLKCIIRRNSYRVADAVKYDKTMKSLDYLGCSLEEFKAHIESQWQDGMTWDNYAHDGWHIDHIVPLDWYIKNSDDSWQANHYTNLRPLWAKENLSKSNKIK